MKDEAVWLISGGPMQQVAAQKICDNGYQLILSDKNPNAMCRSMADLFLSIDTFDVDAHLSACKEVQAHYDIKAVMTFAADCHYTVAKLAAHLELPHIDPKISEICRDKFKTRELLLKYGLLQPESYIVSTYEEALKIIKSQSDKAFVLKATDSSGSRGFQNIGDISSFIPDSFLYTKQYSSMGKVIVEERLNPD